MVAGADQVVVRVESFVVCVAREVIGKETYGLHEGEKARGVRDVLHFNWSEEAGGSVQ